MHNEKNIDELDVVGYNFIEVNGAAGIKITEGKFENVIYTYSNVSFSDAENTNENAVLSFNFDVVDIPDTLSDFAEINSYEFKNIIGNILMSILVKGIESNESTAFDTEESPV